MTKGDSHKIVWWCAKLSHTTLMKHEIIYEISIDRQTARRKYFDLKTHLLTTTDLLLQIKLNSTRERESERIDKNKLKQTREE